MTVSVWAYAGESRWRARLEGKEASEARPFEMDSTEFEVGLADDTTAVPEVVLTLRPTWDHLSIICNKRPARATEGTQELRVPVLLTGERTAVHIEAVDIKGMVHHVRYEIHFPEFAEFQKEHSSSSKKKWTWVNAVDVTPLSYVETGKSAFSQIGLTYRTTFDYSFGSKGWMAGFLGYYTLLALSSNQTGIAARYLGLNLRAGYQLGFVKDPWVLTLLGGYYYTTMSVTNDAFGYRNLGGPQLYPVLSRAVGPRDRLSLSLKYSPIFNRLSLLSLENREIAAGLTWSHGFANGHKLITSVNYADLALNFGGVDIRASSISIGLGYAL